MLRDHVSKYKVQGEKSLATSLIDTGSLFIDHSKLKLEFGARIYMNTLLNTL